MALSSQSCILTVIPGGIVPVEGATSRYRFSVHVAPRLVPGFGENELGYFPPFTVWPSNAASFARVELKGLIFGDPIATVGASRISVDPDPTLWEALFSPTMPVSPFDPAAFETKFGSSKVRSYPALSLHAWQTKFLAERMIENDTVAPTPDELAAALGSIVDLNGGGVTKELDSAIEGSFPQQGRSSRFARYLPTGPSRPLYGTSLETVADHFQLLTFLAPRATAAYLAANPTISPPSIDFHRALALLADHPALLRLLGLVIDYECDLTPNDPPNPFAGCDSVQLGSFGWENISPSGGFVYPQTAITTGTFLAAPSPDGLLTNDRMVDLTTSFDPQFPSGWGVTSLDVESMAVKTLNLGNTVRTAMAFSKDSSSRPAQIDVPAPRSGGLSLMKGDRAKTTWDAFRRTADLLAVADPGQTFLYLDDLVRGYRVDVFDTTESATTAQWRSLMRRDVVYTPSLWTGQVHAPDDHLAVPGPPAAPELPVYSNEGVISTAVTASPDPAAPDDKFIADALFEWSGWSFVAPRPGGALADGGTGPAPNPDPTNPDLSLTIDVGVTAGSLPRLRYGHAYRFRLRTADIAGCGPLPDEGLLDEFAGSPTEPESYVRWEPVPPPALAQQDELTMGESLTNIVIRSRDKSTDVTGVVRSARHVLPPSATADTVELHGALDSLTAYDAYELLARRDGRRLGVGASDSWITPAYEGLADEHSDASDPTPYFPFGQHPVVPPWLVDPMATGFRLRGPGVIEQFLEFTPSTADEWMNARGWRLEVKGLDAGSLVTVTVNSLKRTLVVGIPKGEQFTMPLSSTIPAAKIGHLSVASIIDANAMSIDDPVQSENDRRTRIERVVKGRNRQVTPQTAMTLVHAVQVPLLEPYVQADTLSVLRDLGQTTARFGGVVRVHRRSSGRIDLDLDWDEHLDTGPTGLSLSPGRAVLEPVEVPYPINGTATTTQGVSGVLQDFGDTKHRLVSVGVTATSRYADYFARERRGVTITSTALTLIGADDDGIQPFSERVVARLSGRVLERGTHYVMDYEAGTIKRTGAIANTLVHIRFVPLPLATSTTAAKRVPVHVLSTARPAPPVVRDVIPVFEDSPWLDYPPPPKTTGKRRIRDGRTLRIYFERPWFSSGADETIAVVLQRSQRAAADGQYTGVVSPSRANGTPRPSFQRLTSAWGRDPLVNGDPVTRGLTVASFPLAVETDAHPKWVMGLTPPGIDLPVIVVPHKVEFDEGTQLWFTDVSLRLGQAYRPFVRLALARYQPYSLPGAELSEIVTIDAAQLSPNRTITVSGSGTTRSVSFSGPAYTAANTGVPPTGFFFNFSEADTTVHRKPAPVVEVQVQRREVGGPYDSGDPNIGWIDVSNRTYTLTLNPIPAANGDQRFTATGIDVTVPDGSQARLVIREFEVDTRPLGESGNRRRLAFLDTYRI